MARSPVPSPASIPGPLKTASASSWAWQQALLLPQWPQEMIPGQPDYDVERCRRWERHALGALGIEGLPLSHHRYDALRGKLYRTSDSTLFDNTQKEAKLVLGKAFVNQGNATPEELTEHGVQEREGRFVATIPKVSFGEAFQALPDILKRWSEAQRREHKQVCADEVKALLQPWSPPGLIWAPIFSRVKHSDHVQGWKLGLRCMDLHDPNYRQTAHEEGREAWLLLWKQWVQSDLPPWLNPSVAASAPTFQPPDPRFPRRPASALSIEIHWWRPSPELAQEARRLWHELITQELEDAWNTSPVVPAILPPRSRF